MRWMLLLVAVGCTDVDSGEDVMLAEPDAVVTVDKADAPGWETGDTLHARVPVYAGVDASSRRVHSLWIAGSPASRVPVTITARAHDGYDVRIALLGPLANGQRAVLGAAGYSARTRNATVTLDVATSGEHLVVVGSHALARETFYDLTATTTADASRVDVLASPKDGALVGDAQRLVTMELGDVLAGYNADVEVELWASPPMQWWNAQHIGSSYASGTQVNAIVPASVQAGDDLRLVVREPDGRTFDTGVTTRFVPQPTAFARLDAMLYGDLTSLQIAGVVGYFEGVADLRLRSETRNRELARDIQRSSRPGQAGIGFGAFDATFIPEFSVAAKDGELLSIGFINGNGDYRRLGCFEYCNNLSGLSSCTGGARSCP